MRTLAVVAIALVACTRCTQPGAECALATDCGEASEAPACERCPAPTEAFCVAGACGERAANAVDVTATFLVARALDGVNGLVWVLAVDDRDCPAEAAFPADLNVLAAGQKTLSGGDLHEDVPLAGVPEGPVLVLALATSGAAGEGDVLGGGCARATARAPALAIPQVELAAP